jgi:tripeptide aminopeptidase
MVNEQRVVDTFIELVKIDSESGEEEKIIAHLIDRFKELGAEVIFQKVEPDKEIGNIIAKIPANRGPDFPIIFSAHTDTVKNGKGIKPVIKDGMIRSDGTTILGGDDKAAIAAIIEAIRVFKEKDITHGPIEVVLSYSEEIGMIGARKLDYDLIKSKYCFILDDDGDVGKIITATPAKNSLEFEIIGKAAHAGLNPEDGINAIQVAGKALAEMRIGRIDEDTTCNMAIISGGSAINVVPDRCLIKGEARSRINEKLDKLCAEIKETVERVASENGAKCEVRIKPGYNAYQHNEDDDIVKIAAKAMKNIGIEAEYTYSGGGTDANIFITKGIESLNMSAGYDKAHMVEEHVSIDGLVKGTELLINIAQEIAEAKK